MLTLSHKLKVGSYQKINSTTSKILQNITTQWYRVQGQDGKVTFHLDVDDTADVVILSLFDALSDTTLTTDSVYLWKLPYALTNKVQHCEYGMRTKLKVVNAADYTAWVEIESSELLLYTWLSTQVLGRWKENAYVVIPNVLRLVQLDSDEVIDAEVFRNTTRVAHLLMYNKQYIKSTVAQAAW